MGQLKRAFVLVVMASALMVGAQPAQAAFTCGEVGLQYWCNAPATDYPGVKGYHGYVGRGGGPCNANPKGTTFAPGAAGICAAPAPLSVWKHTAAGWQAARLDDGTRVYVHPWSTQWRWIYTGGSWYAIAASSLTIEWRVR